VTPAAILAVPFVRMAEVQPLWPGELYRVPLVWHRWECPCGASSEPENYWSHAAAAIRMGELHQAATQCQRAGQLELFALAGAS
jgi:hypothetical protein